MNLFSTLIWFFTILAFLFLFLSVRSDTDEMIYALMGLGSWGVAYLLNRYKRKK